MDTTEKYSRMQLRWPRRSRRFDGNTVTFQTADTRRALGMMAMQPTTIWVVMMALKVGVRVSWATRQRSSFVLFMTEATRLYESRPDYITDQSRTVSAV